MKVSLNSGVIRWHSAVYRLNKEVRAARNYLSNLQGVVSALRSTYSRYRLVDKSSSDVLERRSRTLSEGACVTRNQSLCKPLYYRHSKDVAKTVSTVKSGAAVMLLRAGVGMG